MIALVASGCIKVGDLVGEIVSELFGYFRKEKSHVAVIKSM